MIKLRVLLISLLSGKTISVARNLRVDGNLTTIANFGVLNNCVFNGRIFDCVGNEYIVEDGRIVRGENE